MISSRPYFLRALHAWIVDNQWTPHVMVNALIPGVSVPKQYVKDGKIVLNLSPNAIDALTITNDWVNFDARFSSVLHRIRLPMMSITGIYAMENGRGMAFEPEETSDTTPPTHTPPAASGSKTRPSLKVVK